MSLIINIKVIKGLIIKILKSESNNQFYGGKKTPLHAFWGGWELLKFFWKLLSNGLKFSSNL